MTGSTGTLVNIDLAFRTSESWQTGTIISVNQVETGGIIFARCRLAFIYFELALPACVSGAVVVAKSIMTRIAAHTTLVAVALAVGRIQTLVHILQKEQVDTCIDLPGIEVNKKVTKKNICHCNCKINAISGIKFLTTSKFICL